MDAHFRQGTHGVLLRLMHGKYYHNVVSIGDFIRNGLKLNLGLSFFFQKQGYILRTNTTFCRRVLVGVVGKELLTNSGGNYIISPRQPSYEV